MEAHPLYTMVKELLPLRVHSMSYGQRRKVEIFGAFLRQHDMLCLDEPMNFIDYESRLRLINYINSGDLQTQLIVITSHYESDISGLNCDVFESDGRFPVSTPKHYSYQEGVRRVIADPDNS
jgi:ABC-type multidrug transport system ATPase subunit